MLLREAALVSNSCIRDSTRFAIYCSYCGLSGSMSVLGEKKKKKKQQYVKVCFDIQSLPEIFICYCISFFDLIHTTFFLQSTTIRNDALRLENALRILNVPFATPPEAIAELWPTEPCSLIWIIQARKEKQHVSNIVDDLTIERNI